MPPTTAAPAAPEATASAPPRSTDTTSAAAGTVVALSVRGGSVDGPSRQQVPLGERVTVRVTSDVADEVHVHGYDRRVRVGAGETAEVSFEADLPGVFEVELEDSGRRLTTLEVQP